MSALPTALREDLSIDLDGAPHTLASWRHPARSPHGGTALLVHGFRGDHHGMDQIARFARATELIVPDLPGFGRTAPTPAESLGTFTGAVDAAIDQLAADRDITLVGHSFGAIVAAHTLAERIARRGAGTTGVTRLVLIGAIARPALEGDQRILTALTRLYYGLGSRLPGLLADPLLSSPAIVALMSRVMATTHDPGTLRYIHDQHARHFSAFADRVSLARAYEVSIRHTVTEVASALAVPVDLIAGTADQIAPWDTQVELRRRLPDARLHALDGVGHLMHYERGEAIAALLDAIAAPEEVRP